ncbi:MAG: L-fucose/L-arabinose isomerase family protein [Nitrososphaerota archaeon]|nr:L-fucose/L-arabinose isomerase family protein [Candidatus Bathyarchaeota archaeon]MDW8049389.1 L-fucose/L-arabinose isomerase family protein [Nitrososphaerota archaeon]
MSTTFGLIVGHREFFSEELAAQGRERMIKVLAEEGFDVVCPSPDETRLGVVGSWEDAKRCAEIFKKNEERIDGIIVSLPNFGDEKAIVNTIRLSGLRVPILVQAFRDRLTSLDPSSRGDSFCGKISVCNNLVQYKIPFSLTSLHTVDPEEKTFREDLKWFAMVCKVVKGLRNIRLGAIGARPSAFNTMRFSEKILESLGISVETLDLSEIIEGVGKLPSSDTKVKAKAEEIKSYAKLSHCSESKLNTLAKIYLIIEEWIRKNDIRAVAIQCWTSLERNLGVMPCVVMSMLSEKMIPAACEVDITGTLSMLILQLASGTPSAIVDWNNNYEQEEDRCIIFHCGNMPKSVLQIESIGFGEIIGKVVGIENAFGVCIGRVREGPMTFARLTTDDVNGKLKAYIGEGEITSDPAETFGAFGVVKVKNLQALLSYVCRNGFEHHVAINRSHTARAIYEALSNYLGIEVYWHQ